ncbi:Uncharacterized protein APZ42_012525 [Daphnia magna]|uniref:Uncharacterized protein n=1 Tax=Daphnia magna TaxID=35525 RepID=A0A162RQN0_9CRUS|nr:Uncharacterized protein APZ42_012525 [Daphnia magna]
MLTHHFSHGLHATAWESLIIIERVNKRCTEPLRTIEVDNFSTQKSPTQPFLTEFCAPFVNSFDAAIVCPEMFSRDSIR